MSPFDRLGATTWILMLAACNGAPAIPAPATVDTDDRFFDVQVCTPEPMDHPSHPRATCDPTPVEIEGGVWYTDYTVGCMVDGICYGRLRAGTSSSLEFSDVVALDRDQRTLMACCSQDGVAYRYMTFIDELRSALTVYYDDNDELQSTFQLFNSVPPVTTYCLDPDGESLTWVNSIWRGKILDHCL